MGVNGNNKESERQDQIVHIAYATDDNFAKVAGISLLSLLENNVHISSLEIHFFDDGISESNKEKLRLIAGKYKRQISFYDVGAKLNQLAEEGVAGYGCTFNKGMTAYSRLFAADILPTSINRILYLDCDTMVNGGIEDLYSIDLGGYV